MKTKFWKIIADLIWIPMIGIIAICAWDVFSMGAWQHKLAMVFAIAMFSFGVITYLKHVRER